MTPRRLLHKARVGAHFLRKHTGSRVAEILHRSELCRPSMVCTILTSRCNFHCSFCGHPKMTRIDEMLLVDWTRIVEALGRWLGIYRINFLGGEPLLYPHLFELLALCRDRGVMAGITTNASLLDEPTIRELARVRPFNISISIDGLTPETHDRLRGFPGSLERIMQALDLLERHLGRHTRVALRTNVLESNLDQLAPLARFTRDRGLHAIGYQPVEYRATDPADESEFYGRVERVPDHRFDGYSATGEAVPDNLRGHWVGDLERLDRAMDELIGLKRQGAPILNSTLYLERIRGYYRNADLIYTIDQPCRAAWENLVILPDGLVRSCTELPPYGDLHLDEPRTIWTSEAARQHRDLCARCNRTCLNMFHYPRSLAEKAELFARFY